MILSDRLTIDGMKRTRDGYLVADVRAARVGIQEYAGSEVGKPDMAVVRIYRPADMVFNKDAMASFTSIPVTVDHPSEAVTADNWKRYAVGNTGEDIARDGEFIRVPIIVKDAAAIRAIEGGKRQLSMGYTTDLDWTPGVTADGLTYDAKQTNLTGNHLAIVSAARGGPALTIDGDNSVATKTITFDGLPLETTDAGEAAINKLLGQIADAKTARTALETQVGTLTAAAAVKDAEIVALNSKLKDAEITPAKLHAAAAALALVADAAKKIVPTLDTSKLDEAGIKSAVVAAKLGDAAKTITSADAINAAFAVLSATVADSDPLRDSLLRQPVAPAAGEKMVADAYKEMVESLTNPKKAA